MSERMLAGNTSLLDLLDVLERVYQTRSRLVTLHVQEISSAAQVGRYLGQPKEVADSTGEARREGEF
jgi:adhesin transport system outer membrane protein